MLRLKNNKSNNNEQNLDIDDKQSLNEQALQWIVTLSSGEATAKDIQRCKKWRKNSQVHENAFEKARKLWLKIGSPSQVYRFQLLLESTAHQPTYSSEALYFLHTYKYFLILVFSILIYSSYVILNRADIETGFGEVETFELLDHSEIILNTNTALNIDMNDSQREISLKRGEVYFEVAHQVNKPFKVRVDNHLIEVNGAKFNIQLTGSTTIISALSGQLSVRDHNSLNQNLHAEQKLVIDKKNNTISIEKLNAQDVTSWIKGKLQFNNVQIQDILDIIKNYDENFWIIHLDQQHQQIRLNTTINTLQIDAWLMGLTDLMPFKIKRLGKFIVIYD